MESEKERAPVGSGAPVAPVSPEDLEVVREKRDRRCEEDGIRK